MRAVIRERSHEGGIPNFVLQDKVDLPDVQDHDVKIKVKACGVSSINTPVDKLNFSGCVALPVGHDVAGVITDAGPAVKSFTIGDRIAGILPLDWKYSGLAEECLISEYDIVHLPDTVSYSDAAALLGDGVKAYTGLHYLGRACAGDTILVINAASGSGSVAVQLAQSWGTKVLGTVCSDEERYYLEELPVPLGQIFEVQPKNGLLTSAVMEETGGIGVDVIIDDGATRQFAVDEDVSVTREPFKYPVAGKHDVISCLAVGGRWVTSLSNLQLDPPHSEMLYLRGASVCYLFPGCWALSAAQYGRYQHMMREIIEKLSKRTLNPNISKKIPLSSAIDILPNLSDNRIGKIVFEM